jgi:hypothetical protein
MYPTATKYSDTSTLVLEYGTLLFSCLVPKTLRHRVHEKVQCQNNIDTVGMYKLLDRTHNGVHHAPCGNRVCLVTTTF